MIKQNNFRVITDEAASRYKFNFCKLCSFYECELVEEYMLFKKNNPDIDLPTYDQNALANGCPMKQFVSIECGRKRVAEGIGDHFKIETNTDKWEPKQPVFISAQTGQGKNYFIEKTLLPYIRELNLKKHTDQKVLIISNRTALRLQIENRINNQDLEQDTIYSYGEYVDVISYQSILNRVDDLKRKQAGKTSRYIFAICDEAHFFTSDAMFNPNTDKILTSIVSIFSGAIRIYMSATPYECMNYITEYEHKYFPQSQKGVFYHFKRDYSYLDVRYYSAYEKLKNIIVNSGDQRWLIFIDNTNECERLKKILETADKKSTEEGDANASNLKGKVFTVSADSKYNRKFQNMLLSERFDGETKVLIATSVIDNGVSFRGINNIVISDISKDKCLQMVGRGRVDNNDDKITLYIKRFNEEEIENKITDLMKKQDAYHNYDLAYDRSWENKNYNYETKFLNKYYNNKGEDWKNAKYLFARGVETPTRVSPNLIARSLVEKNVSEYRAILEEMRKNDGEFKGSGQKYLEHQLSWFGKKYDEENDISITGISKEEKELIEFLEFHVANETQLFGDKKLIFRKEFTRLHDKVFDRLDINQIRIYGHNLIKEAFEKHNMNYEIKTAHRILEDKKKTYWKIIKFNRESDE